MNGKYFLLNLLIRIPDQLNSRRLTMKTKLLLFAVTGLAIAASAPTFAAGTYSPLVDAKNAAPNLTADAQPTIISPTTQDSTCLAMVDLKTIADAKVLSDPDWKTISAMRGVIDDGPATLKTAQVNSSPQGVGGSVCATMTLAAGTGSHTSAPAIGYSVTDLAKLTKPDRSAVAFITA
jgi:hypothetical protein